MQDKSHTLSQETKEWIAEWFRCVQICEECSDDMIRMGHSGEGQMMANCIRLCRDCADVCALAGQWMSRSSSLTNKLCSLCADVCEQCSELCEKHAPHHALCGPCAEECRRCAKSCRQMSRTSKAA
jgi:hypothetical protein